MNRRQLFGAAVIPLTIGSSLVASSDIAYTGHVYCKDCRMSMAHSNQDHERLNVYCANPHCEQYEIRYRAPTIELERL